jgi:hypothetical protein
MHRSEERGEAEERCLSLGPDCLAVRHNQARASHFNIQKTFTTFFTVYISKLKNMYHSISAHID